MTHYKYFILTNSNTSLSKRFRVVQTEYRPALEKTQSINKTIEGELDISQGSITEIHSYGVRVREDEPEGDYGDMADLKAFYALNNPNGTPSDLLVLTDHYGIDYYAYMIGNYIPMPMGVEIEGIYAWFIIPVQFILAGLVPEGS